MLNLLKADLCKYNHRWPFEIKMIKTILNPRFWPVLLYRISSYFYTCKLTIIARLFSLSNQVLFGCDIARGAKIEGGLYLPHPQGIVIGEYAQIGKNCIIHQGVTLGARGEEHKLANPIIMDEVEVATGAKLLGGIRIGHYARIGANAVVLKDVPDFGVAVGFPAKTVKFRTDIPQSNFKETLTF